MPGFAWSAGQDGKLRYLNQRFLEYTGKRIEDFDRVAGVTSFGRTEVLHPDDVSDTRKAAAHSVATGDPYVVEHRVRRFDGTYRWFRASAVRVRDPMSQEIGWYGVDIDIDDQKRTDEALRESEQRLNRLISRITFQMNAASLPHAKLMQAIEALGTRVAPALRKEFAGD